MRLVLVDANLVDASGHHRLYSSVLAAEARRRGIEVVLVANQRLRATAIGGVTPRPLLATTCYERFSPDPLFGAFEDVEEGNRRVLAELDQVRDLAGPDDLVLFHTVSHTSLLGIVSWVATLPRPVRPAVAVFLMMPPGIAGQEPFALTDPAAALGYRAAFRLVEEAGLDVAFFASGRQHARLFSRLAGRAVPAHALLTCFDETGAPAAPDPARVLLFAGDAKVSKGLDLVPGVIGQVAPRHRDVAFRVQANPGPAWGRALEIVEALRAMAADHPNLDLHLGGLDARAYADLVGSAGVALMPYDPAEYRAKSSGIAWETIASAGLAVVPSGTWLEEEARAWSAPHHAFAPHTAEAAAEALERAMADAAHAASALAAAADAFAAANGVKTLMDELGAVWTAHGASHRLARPDSLVVPASRFAGEGWHGAEIVGGVGARWSRGTAEIRLRLPGRGRWEIALEGIAMLGEEQVRSARLSVDGEALAVTAALGETGGWRIAGPFGESAGTPPARTLTLALPWERTPAGDWRALGVLATRLTATRIADLAWPLDGVKPEPASPDAVADGTGWTRPTRHASWRAFLDPREDHVLSFAVHASAEPATARGVRVFAGGEALEPRVRIGRGYHVEATLETALLSRTGAEPDIDVVLDAPAAIRMGRVVAVRQRPAARDGAGDGAGDDEDPPFLSHEIALDESFEDPAFHHVETGGPEGAPFRWMGRESEAAIQLPAVFADAGTLAVHVHVVHRVDQEALDGLLIGLDGVYAERYDCSSPQPGVVVRSAIIARPPQVQGRAPVLWLKATRRVDFSAHGDPRTLSVALSRIVVTA